MRNFLIFMICLLQFALYAQDTIYKRSGELIPAKVLEINTKEISYKRFDLIEGPLFVVNKNDIKKIRYATGTIDSFAVEVNSPSNVLHVTRPQKFVYPDTYDQITPTYRRGIYKYQGHHLSDRGVAFVAMEKNQVWKNQEIELNIANGRHNKVIQYTLGFGGLIIGGAGLMGAAILSDFDYPEAGVVTVLVGGGIVVASQIVSFQFKLKRIKNADKIAEVFNTLSKK